MIYQMVKKQQPFDFFPEIPYTLQENTLAVLDSGSRAVTANRSRQKGLGISMNKKMNFIADFSVITAGTIVTALAVYFFMIPSNVLVGSITGLAVILENILPLSMSTITMTLNIILLVVGFVFIGKEFGAKTVYTSILLPVILGILEKHFPDQRSIMGDPFVDMICYVFFSGVGISILFHCNASSGGLDIVAKLLNKFLRIELGSALAVSGIVVSACTLFFYETKIFILSLLGTYLSGVVVDRMIFGFNVKRRVCIISKKEAEIRDFIINHLHSGATVYESIGAYNLEPKRELISIVDKNEYLKLMDFIEKIDQDAFITVYEVHKVIYRPKA